MSENEESRSKKDVIPTRKADHIRINLDKDVQSRALTGFDFLYLEHQALPEINLQNIQLETRVFNKVLQRPFLISSMTGGTREAWEINRLLAKTAQNFGIAMGLGSQRAAIENPDLAYSFKIRDVAPDILLFSNLGAVQLNYGYSIKQCQQAVDMIEADALVLHLNPLQEALQPEGETCFEGLLKKIETVCSKIEQPVIVKEVGWGISGSVAKKLMDAGVSAIDVAGAGGTSWAKVEMHRADSQIDAEIAGLFDDWGIPTVDSILQVKQAAPGLPIFASGGIRNGIDIAKSIALGANLAGIAGKFLKAASQGESALQEVCLRLEKELKVAMFASGASSIEALQNTKIHFR